MKVFVSNNIILIILVVTTAIDASRIFYLPLPKIHSLYEQKDTTTTTTTMPQTIKASVSDEFIPQSAIEREELEKRGDDFNWEALIDNGAVIKRRITVNEVAPEPIGRYSSDESLGSRMNDDSETDVSVQKDSAVDEQHPSEESWIIDHAHARAEYLQSNAALNSYDRRRRRNDTLFIVIVGTCCAVGLVGLVAAVTFWYRIQKRAEAAVDAEYPSYGVTGPVANTGKISPSSTMSDRKLAQSAQMFHYQQQRQQMMAQEKAHLDAKPVHSDDSDDEAPTGGDYTVYECPGLAPTGEMEVRNPLFAEHDSTLISSTSGPHSPTSNLYLSTSSSPPK